MSMILQRRRFLRLAVAAVAAPALPRAANAQSYPDRPVRVVVPYAPGGPTDVVTRLLMQKIAEHTGKQFFIENVGGGGGNIAMGRVAKMPPDGYTLLMINPSYVINPTLQREVPYRFGQDFDMVSLAVLTTHVIATHPSVPARTLKDLVELIKANPRKYSYASPGTGTRCTTLTQLPLAFCAGRIENCEPVPGLTATTVPQKVRSGNVSTITWARWPIFR